MSVTLVVMGLLSKRLGSSTQTPPYYVGFYISALMVIGGVVVRLLDFISVQGNALALREAHPDTVLRVLLYNGLPALGVTIGVIVAWRYWSWLLAERN
ncbi:MAG: hypothetical protein H7175_15215 [Burkholderiales bacterium]|nr:hypothetical protein [Anaerolineae bacterium]